MPISLKKRFKGIFLLIFFRISLVIYSLWFLLIVIILSPIFLINHKFYVKYYLTYTRDFEFFSSPKNRQNANNHHQ